MHYLGHRKWQIKNKVGEKLFCFWDLLSFHLWICALKNSLKLSKIRNCLMHHEIPQLSSHFSRSKLIKGEMLPSYFSNVKASKRFFFFLLSRHVLDVSPFIWTFEKKIRRKKLSPNKNLTIFIRKSVIVNTKDPFIPLSAQCNLDQDC